MEPSLALWLPLEVLDGVGHVHLGAIDAGGLKGLIEDAAGGSDERLAFLVLAVTRLLADEHHARMLAPLAEDRLRARPVEIAAAAAGRLLAQAVERQLAGEGQLAREARLPSSGRLNVHSLPSPSFDTT